MHPPEDRRPGWLWRLCYRLGEDSEGAGPAGALIGLATLAAGLYFLHRLGYSLAFVLVLLFASAAIFSLVAARTVLRPGAKRPDDDPGA